MKKIMAAVVTLLLGNAPQIAGSAAVGKPVSANENIKGACEGVEQPFTPEELDRMIVRYPYAFMDVYIGIVPPWYLAECERDCTREQLKAINDLMHNKSRDYFRAFGYYFSSQHAFRRGERVLFPYRDLAYRHKDTNLADYYPGIVVGYDAQNKTYTVQPSANKSTGPFKAEELGKYKIRLRGGPSHSKNQALFTQEQLNVLPVPYQASSVIGEIAINPIMAETGGGKSIPVASNTPKAQMHFSFNVHNQFKRGDLVIVERSDKSYRYGIVLGCLAPGQYRVQVDKELQKKDVPAQLIGKLKLDFTLLDRSSEEKMEAEKAIVAGMQAQTPEVLKTIFAMAEEYDPKLATPIAKIKDAIRDNDKKKLEKALEFNKEYLEAVDATGYTPLLFAVFFNNPDAVDLLLKKGANPYKKVAIGHEKNKVEHDAYSLAQTLGMGNSEYDEIIAILELYRLGHPMAEQSQACKPAEPSAVVVKQGVEPVKGSVTPLD